MKRLRKLKGWNQTELAEAAGMEQSTISKIENGWDGATLRTLNYIAGALSVPTYQLFLDDTSVEEIRLISVYRSLSDDRKRGWQDMAQMVLADPHAEDQSAE